MLACWGARDFLGLPWYWLPRGKGVVLPLWEDEVAV